MSGIARTGDIGVGVCTSHIVPIPMVGTLLGTCGTVTTNGIPSGLVGDLVIGGCGHIGVVVSGTSVVKMTGRPAAMIGSAFVGAFSGTIVGGSGTVIGK